MKPKTLCLLSLVLLVVQTMAQDEAAQQRKLSNSDTLSLGKRLFFQLEAEHEQYPNLASFHAAYMAMGYRVGRKLNLSGGVLAIKQFTNHESYGIDRTGLRLNLSYSITKELDFNIWGQYITSSPIRTPSDFLLPQTGTGASVMLDLGGGSQLGIGAAYQYDDKKERWDYQSGGKLKLNF